MGRLFTLSPRLAMLASLVPQGARIADIGTDHAFLPVYLQRTGRIREAVAADINEKPLQRAAQTIERHAARNIRLVQGDGLSCLSAKDADVIIIAGMGGDTIASILRGAPWALEGRHLLLLQPVTAAERLRMYLYDTGYELLDERIVREDRRLYPVMTVRGSAAQDAATLHGPADVYCYFSRPLIRRGGTEVLDYLKRVEGSARKTASGLVSAGKSADAEHALLSALADIGRECVR